MSPQHPLRVSLHRLIKKVSEDIESLKFNTAIAAMMEFLNELTAPSTPAQGASTSERATANSQEEQKAVAKRAVSRELLATFLKLLAPFAPHISEELWEMLGEKGSIHRQPWPKYDPKIIKEEKVTVVIQVNGRLRETLVLPTEEAKEREKVLKRAKEREKVQKYLRGQKIKKTIFLPGKLVNFVI